MDIKAILFSVAIVAIVGLFIGIFLGIASIIFKVFVDEREEKIGGVLPGNNCGGCGYPGCSGLAAAIVKGEAPVNACPVGGEAVGNQIAEIMGVEAVAGKKMVAFVKCQGDCDKVKEDYNYTGQQDCQMLAFVPNQGPKSCNFGCQGFGSCVKVCPFDAIHVVNGVAVVDKEKCKACGKCIAVCPRNLIELIPYDAKYAVACSSKAKGAATTKACSAGCIGCGICKKNCEKGAVEVTDFHAKIDQDLCIGCGACAEKCPKKSIITL
ncbi:MAG: RnfABCDGE type electron transport complex subunit B [Lachnospiraceae bacterium]|nr:RnfABCDGE type electron transport complex subunit B [Lachnospiraceae bacterium]